MNWRLGRALVGHDVRTVEDLGWKGIRNGRLLRLAEAEFDVLITVDRSIAFQQNIERLDLAIIILRVRRNKLRHLLPLVPELLEALQRIERGRVISIEERKDGKTP